MLKNFFLLAFRNYIRNKSFVLINILGLGISISCCIVAYLNWRFDADMNKMHVNNESIYKVNISRNIKDRLQDYSITPISLAPAMQNDIAGIDRLVRYMTSGATVRYEIPDKEAKIFDIRIAFADKEFLRMFTFPLELGDASAFEDEGKILLTEETSKKYFGETNPIGESITMFDGDRVAKTFIVGGVFKKIPMNNILNFEALTLYPNYIKHNKVEELDWKNWTAGTFLQVSNPAKIKDIEASLAKYKDIQNKNREDWKIERFFILSLKDFTEVSRDIWSNWIGSSMHPAAKVAPTIMALLIMLLACFNFINTAISTSNKRLKEIGIRKVIGGQRRGLIAQFLGENFIICFLALLLSFIINIFLIDEWQKMWVYELTSQHYLSILNVWLFLAGTLIFTAV